MNQRRPMMLNIPRRISGELPAQYDPLRRLLAAVAVLAVTDYIRPPKNLSIRDRATAEIFVQENTALLADLAQVNEWTVIKTLNLRG